MTSVDSAYYGREQTLVKHQMLRKYLGPAARILGSVYNCFVYVDCCSGPWNSTTNDFSDTSFSIATEELRSAREYLATKQRHVEFRCLFIEKELFPYCLLEKYCKSVTDMELIPSRGDFTDKVDEITAFISENKSSFPFFFIDPTGWSPLAITKIAPLLQYRPSEVLINFMTSHIKRFLESAPEFEANFGPVYMQKVLGLNGQELDDSAAYAFADEIRKFYRYACTLVVLNPLRDQTHFHLIYGTRHPKGREKFKEAEKSCFGLMQAVRLDAQRRHEGPSLQQELFSILPVQDRYVESLRRHYLEQAIAALDSRGRSPRFTEAEAWDIASRFPLVWEADVQRWWGNRSVNRGQGQAAGA